MSRVPHVAIYVRVSTNEQAEDGLSKDAQPANCLKKLDEAFGAGTYTYEIFQDLGKSGGSGPKPWAASIGARERKGLWSMIQKLKAGEFTHVCAFRGDRIYRDSLGYMGLYIEVMKPRGVTFVFVAEDFDESISGQLTSGILATIAEFRRKQIGENIGKTLDFRRANGLYLGTIPFGWRQETPEEHEGRRRNIRPEPREAEVVVRIKDMYLSGMSEQAIADTLNREPVPHKRSVGKWQGNTVNCTLTCPIHAGLSRITRDGQLGQGFHYQYRLYDESEYRRILDRISRNRKRLKGVAHTQPFRLFSGIAYCGHCGRRLQSSFHTDSPSYRCLGTGDSQDGSHVYVHAKRLEEVVVGELARLSRDPEVRAKAESEIERLVRSQDEQIQVEMQSKRRAIEELGRQSANLVEAIKDGVIPNRRARAAFDEISEAETSLHSEIRDLSDRLSAAESRTQLMTSASRALEDFPRLWEAMTDAERRECLHTVVEKVEVYVQAERKWIRLKLAMEEEPREIEVLRGAERYRKNRLAGAAALTERELAALKHVLDGAHYSQVAGYFESSPSSAHAILSNAAEKLGVKDFGEAAKLAEPIITRVQGQLPLYGKCPSHGWSRRRLQVMELQVLEMSSEGLCLNQIALRTCIPEDRVEELLSRALRKIPAETAEDGAEMLRKHPELLPKSMENRGNRG